MDTTCCRDIIYSSIGDNRTIIANNKSEYHSSIAQIVNVRTNPGMITSVVLPDSSIVYLNSESSLSYPLVFDGKTREVHL